MSTKKVQTTQFAPAGMSAYNQTQPQVANTLSDFMQNPLQSSFFNTQQQMAQKQISQMGSSNISTFLNNIRSIMGSGGAGNSPFMTAQLSQIGRGTSGQSANAFNQNLLNANQMRMGAANTGAGYKPLATGQTEQTQGLGTWLPQVIGAGVGAAASFIPGAKGASGLFGSAAGQLGSSAMMSASPFISQMSMGNQNAFLQQPISTMNATTGNLPMAPLNSGGYTPFFQ